MNGKIPVSVERAGKKVMEDAYKRFLDGDENALLELMREYQDGLILYLNSLVHDLNAADELCSEVFIRLVLRKPKFRGNSSFKSFLYGIGRNIALEYIRRNKRKRTVSLDENSEIPGASDPMRSFFDKEQKNALYRAISKLKPEYAQVLWLTYFEELSNQETAFVMKKSLSAVKSLLHRAKPALKSELEKEGFSYDEL